MCYSDASDFLDVCTIHLMTLILVDKPPCAVTTKNSHGSISKIRIGGHLLVPVRLVTIYCTMFWGMGEEYWRRLSVEMGNKGWGR